MIIAVTGSIGSGKSGVARELASLLQAKYCDTDSFCRRVMGKGEEGWRRAKAVWGRRFLAADGSIDRAGLREAVFNEPSVRLELEGILHPMVHEYLSDLISRCKSSGQNLVVEVPLLFETGWQDEFDTVVTVYATRSQCIDRVMKRDKVSEEQAMKVLDAQMDVQEKVRLSDYVIDNSGSEEKTHLQVEALSLDFAGKEKSPESGYFSCKNT